MIWVTVFYLPLSVLHDKISLCLPVQVWVANFEHPRVNTCSLYASPTGLSPYLRFGCLSCRVLYYNLRELYMKVLYLQLNLRYQFRLHKHTLMFFFFLLSDHQIWNCSITPLLFFLSFVLHQLRKRCSPPLSLFGQLLWREFFYTAATNNPNFDRMEGNPICVQVSTHLTNPVTKKSQNTV